MSDTRLSLHATETASASASGGQSRSRARIPQSEWPNILRRQQRGESKSAIARDYKCTPAAIAYILKKADQAGITPADGAEAGAQTAAQGTDSDSDGAGNGTAGSGAAGGGTGGGANSGGGRRMTLRAPATTGQPESAGDADAGSNSEEATRGDEASTQPAATAAAEPARSQAAAPSGPSRADPRRAPAAGSSDSTGDDLQQRLTERVGDLNGTYEAWLADKSDDNASELRAAIHEMRKVLARFEIEVAASRGADQPAEPFRYPGERSRGRGDGQQGAGRGGGRGGRR